MCAVGRNTSMNTYNDCCCLNSSRSSKELFLITVQRVHPALLLRRRSPELESNLLVDPHLFQLFERRRAHVLHTVLDTLQQIGQEALNAALVDHSTRDTLGNFDLLFIGKVSCRTTLGHRFNRTHSSILLQSHPVLEKVLTRRLFGARQHTAHHDARCAARQCLDDVPGVTDSTIGNHGDTVFRRVQCNIVHCTRLRSTDGAHFLCCA